MDNHISCFMASMDQKWLLSTKLKAERKLVRDGSGKRWYKSVFMFIVRLMF